MHLEADARIALYYAPAADDPLWRAGSAWLGRDAITDTRCGQPAVAGMDRLTHRPCGYGFHATLKAPFRLTPGVGWDGALALVRTAARRSGVFALPALEVTALDGFMALMQLTPSPALRGLADLMVETLDPLRAPLAEAELAHRRGGGLSETQEDMLQRWGYVDVFGLWRFHMTLSELLTAAQHQAIAPIAVQHFQAACAAGREVRDVCVFVQPGAKRPFRLVERVALGAG
jgi:hypothetical protein